MGVASRSPSSPVLAVLAAGALLAAGCDHSEAPSEDPFATAEANVGEWTWIDVVGSTCRDGSSTGLGVRLQDGADGLVIFLDGGGACYNAFSCGRNRAFYGEAQFPRFASLDGEIGLFLKDAAGLNPVGTWDAVFVPYCTGDDHTGDASDVVVPGVEGRQQFAGRRNMERFVDLLAPYFRDREHVLLTGSSAGGYGALYNVGLVAEAFPEATVTVVNDSGPVFEDDAVFSPELQRRFRSLWALDANLPLDFPDRDAPDGDGLANAYAYFAARYPDVTFGLLAFDEDAVIRSYLGPGAVTAETPTPLDAATYRRALYDEVARLPSSWGAYVLPGERHVFLDEPGVLTTFWFGFDQPTVYLWLRDLIDGRPHVVTGEVDVVES